RGTPCRRLDQDVGTPYRSGDPTGGVFPPEPAVSAIPESGRSATTPPWARPVPGPPGSRIEDRPCTRPRPPTGPRRPAKPCRPHSTGGTTGDRRATDGLRSPSRSAACRRPRRFRTGAGSVLTSRVVFRFGTLVSSLLSAVSTHETR